MAHRPSYDRYIESAEWKAFRQRYFKKMPKTCLACEGQSRITLHHITYDRFGREKLTDVVPLCFDCHEKLHRHHTKSNRSPLNHFRSQLISIFGLDIRTAKERTGAWQAAYRPLTKSQRKAEKKRDKMIRKMWSNKRFHERMCDAS